MIYVQLFDAVKLKLEISLAEGARPQKVVLVVFLKFLTMANPKWLSCLAVEGLKRRKVSSL